MIRIIDARRGRRDRRYPRDVEASVYFCAIEAMQNIAKYAETAAGTLRR